MSTDLNNLLPSEIVEYINESRFDIVINLRGTKFKNRFPKIKIIFDNQLLDNVPIIDSFQYKYSSKLEIGKNYNLEFDFYNRLDTDTIVDNHGKIIEDLAVHIDSIIINGIDIIGTKLIFNLGEFTPRFSTKKLQYYTKNNIPIPSTKSLHLTENGTWKISLQAPVLAYLNQFITFFEKHEFWPNDKLMHDIYATINNIRKLENQLDKINWNNHDRLK